MNTSENSIFFFNSLSFLGLANVEYPLINLLVRSLDLLAYPATGMERVLQQINFFPTIVKISIAGESN